MLEGLVSFAGVCSNLLDAILSQSLDFKEHGTILDRIVPGVEATSKILSVLESRHETSFSTVCNLCFSFLCYHWPRIL